MKKLIVYDCKENSFAVTQWKKKRLASFWINLLFLKIFWSSIHLRSNNIRRRTKGALLSNCITGCSSNTSLSCTIQCITIRWINRPINNAFIAFHFDNMYKHNMYDEEYECLLKVNTETFFNETLVYFIEY